MRIYPEGNSAVIYNNLKGGKAIVTATYKGKTYSCNVVSYSCIKPIFHAKKERDLIMMNQRKIWMNS